MGLNVGANDLVKVWAVRPAAIGMIDAYIDVTGQRTGTIGGPYTPSWIGEPGWAKFATAQALDSDTGSGDLAIAFQNTAQERDELIRDSDAWP